MNNLSGGYIMVDLNSPNKVKQLEKAAQLNKPLLVYYADGTAEWGRVAVTYETVDDVEIPTYHITTANGFVTVEADGNVSLRPLIVEGDVITPTVTNITFTYAKWSLCGTHLMIVIAGVAIDDTAFSNNALLGTIYLPEYIMNKIATLTSQGRVSVGQLWSFVDFNANNIKNIALSKDTNIGALKSICWGTGTFTVPTGTFRIQYDLLIDNE